MMGGDGWVDVRVEVEGAHMREWMICGDELTDGRVQRSPCVCRERRPVRRAREVPHRKVPVWPFRALPKEGAMRTPH